MPGRIATATQIAMYQVDWVPGAVRALRERGLASPAVGRNVWCLGFTSLLTDLSSEMITSILPAYLVLHLRLTPLAFGAVDGVYQGIGTIVRWVGGISADRWGRHKQVALAGYVMSTLSRLGWLVAGSATGPLTGVVAFDRIGKGIRTAPRDALISLSAPPANLGRAFGVHRALDAAGAMLGPLTAFALLAMAPDGYDLVFVASTCVAVVGLAVLQLFVVNVRSDDRNRDVQRLTTTDFIAPLKAPRFRLLVMAGSALAFATISDAFIYLVLQRQAPFAPSAIPLLYVGTSFAYLALALPVGSLADRVGRARVFIAGHLALLAAYAGLLAPSAGRLVLISSPALLGAYYAATDSVLAALASETLPASVRATGLSLLGTATGLSRLGASLVFGLVWTQTGAHGATLVFAIGLTLGIGYSAFTLSRTQAQTP